MAVHAHSHRSFLPLHSHVPESLAGCCKEWNTRRRKDVRVMHCQIRTSADWNSGCVYPSWSIGSSFIFSPLSPIQPQFQVSERECEIETRQWRREEKYGWRREKKIKPSVCLFLALNSRHFWFCSLKLQTLGFWQRLLFAPSFKAEIRVIYAGELFPNAQPYQQ